MFIARPSRAKLNHTVSNEIYGLFTFSPPKMAEKDRAPVDISLVLDHSGSMAYQKLDFVRKSCVKLVELLKDTDTVSVVLFESRVTVLAERVLCTAEGKTKLIGLINQVRDMGGTNLSGGLFKGLEYVAGPKEGVVRKCLLFTDGKANEGELDTTRLARMALEMRNRTGISTFGYGSGYDADLLSALAQNGGTYFIDAPDKILTAFGTEFGGLVSTFGQNVEVFLKPSEGVEIVEVLNDVDVEAKDGGVLVKCDDLLAELPYHVAVKLKVKDRDNAFPRETTLVTAKTKFANLLTAKLDELTASIKVNFVKPSEEDQDDKAVMEEIAIYMVAKAQVEAMKMADMGNYDGAQVFMAACADSVRNISEDASQVAAGTVAFLGQDSYQVGGKHTVGSTYKKMSSRRGGGDERIVPTRMNAKLMSNDQKLYATTFDASAGARPPPPQHWTGAQPFVASPVAPVVPNPTVAGKTGGPVAPGPVTKTRSPSKKW